MHRGQRQQWLPYQYRLPCVRSGRCQPVRLQGKDTEDSTEDTEENTDQPEDTDLCKHHREHDDTCGYLPESEDSGGVLVPMSAVSALLKS